MSIQFQQLDDPSPPAGSAATLELVRRRAAKRIRIRRGARAAALIGSGLVALVAVVLQRSDDERIETAGSGSGLTIEVVGVADVSSDAGLISIRMINNTDRDGHYSPLITIEREVEASTWDGAYVCGSISPDDGAGGECHPGKRGLLELVLRNLPAQSVGPVETIAVTLPPGRYRLSRTMQQPSGDGSEPVDSVIRSAPIDVD